MNGKRQVAQYIISDLVSTNIGWLLFNIFRYYLLPINKEIASLSVYLSYHKIIEGQILFPVLFLCIFYLSGYYNQPFLKSRLEEFFTTLYSLLIGTLIIFFIAIINDLSYGDYGYSAFIGIFVILFACVYPCRAIITGYATRQIHSGKWGYNTLIIGAGKNAHALAREINRQNQSPGFRLIGYIKNESDTTQNPSDDLPQFQPEYLFPSSQQPPISQCVIIYKFYLLLNMIIIP